MARILKWLGMGLVVVLLALLGAVLLIYLNTLRRMNRTYDISPQPVAIPTDPASLAKGEQIYLSHCLDCHGPDLEGDLVFEDPMMGRIVSSNLTPGEGSPVAGYSDEDWVLALRHGIGPDRKSLIVMPSEYYYHLNDRDLGALIAFLKSAPPVDNELGESKTTFLGTMLSGLGMLGKVFVAEHIDHNASRPEPVPEEASVAYGEYVVAHVGCRSCHGEDLRGGKSADPTAKPAPNLTKSGRLAIYDSANFATAMRTGVTPDGVAMDAGEMPWPAFQHLTDTELQAMFLYLQGFSGAE